MAPIHHMRSDNHLSETPVSILVTSRMAEVIDEANGAAHQGTRPALQGSDFAARCEQCGQTFDMRDLGALLHHNLMGKGHKPLPRN